MRDVIYSNSESMMPDAETSDDAGGIWEMHRDFRKEKTVCQILRPRFHRTHKCLQIQPLKARF